MPSILRRTQFGNPILRAPTEKLSEKQIKSEPIQKLISNMQYTLKKRKYGVGLAATQVGKNVSLALIGIKPTPNRPDEIPLDSVIINPSFTGVGNKKPMWEGCISFSSGGEAMYAKVPRYKKIKAEWLDEKGIRHKEEISGMPAHVFQHEADHLNGVLFVDRVKDPTTWMTASEYRKRIVRPRLKTQKSKHPA